MPSKKTVIGLSRIPLGMTNRIGFYYTGDRGCYRPDAEIINSRVAIPIQTVELTVTHILHHSQLTA